MNGTLAVILDDAGSWTVEHRQGDDDGVELAAGPLAPWVVRDGRVADLRALARDIAETVAVQREWALGPGEPVHADGCYFDDRGARLDVDLWTFPLVEAP